MSFEIFPSSSSVTADGRLKDGEVPGSGTFVSEHGLA